MLKEQWRLACTPWKRHQHILMRALAKRVQGRQRHLTTYGSAEYDLKQGLRATQRGVEERHRATMQH